MSVNSPSTDNPSLLWETSKAFSRGIITSYIISKKRRQAEQRQILESKLKLAEKEYVKNPSAKRLKEISALRSSLNGLLTKHAESKIRFGKQKMYEHADKAGKYLAYLTRKRADFQTISLIKDRHGNQLFGTKSINYAFMHFYENLYKSEL